VCSICPMLGLHPASLGAATTERRKNVALCKSGTSSMRADYLLTGAVTNFALNHAIGTRQKKPSHGAMVKLAGASCSSSPA